MAVPRRLTLSRAPAKGSAHVTSLSPDGSSIMEASSSPFYKKIKGHSEGTQDSQSHPLERPQPPACAGTTGPRGLGLPFLTAGPPPLTSVPGCLFASHPGVLGPLEVDRQAPQPPFQALSPLGRNQHRPRGGRGLRSTLCSNPGAGNGCCGPASAEFRPWCLQMVVLPWALVRAVC